MGQQRHFVTSALVRGEWLASRPNCFTPGEGEKKPLYPHLRRAKTSTTRQQKPTSPWAPHIVNSIQTTEHTDQYLILRKNNMHMHTVLLQK